MLVPFELLGGKSVIFERLGNRPVALTTIPSAKYTAKPMGQMTINPRNNYLMNLIIFIIKFFLKLIF